MSEDPKDKNEPDVFDLKDVSMNGSESVEDGVGEAEESTEKPAEKTKSPEEELAEQVAALQKDLLYLQAEYDNYRRQAIKERSELSKYAGERLARDLLSVVDIFETALQSEVNEQNWMEFAKGVKLTSAELKNIMEKNGIREVGALGEEFDPRIHEAIGSEPSKDMPPGHVARVFKKPFKYHDRVLRVGQVLVATAAENGSDETPT